MIRTPELLSDVRRAAAAIAQNASRVASGSMIHEMNLPGGRPGVIPLTTRRSGGNWGRLVNMWAFSRYGHLRARPGTDDISVRVGAAFLSNRILMIAART